MKPVLLFEVKKSRSLFDQNRNETMKTFVRKNMINAFISTYGTEDSHIVPGDSEYLLIRFIIKHRCGSGNWREYYRSIGQV